MPAARRAPDARAGDDRTTDLIRWAAFSCVLVPVVLVWFGASLAGALGTALGLAAVTAVCRLLLRRSERCAARQRAQEHAARLSQGPRESHESLRQQRAHAPYGSRRGARHRTGGGARRGGRHSGGSAPVG
ncbi:hypothetical protein ACIRG4_08010 [Streptomyces sp. NPDC102395]|uniref:hypothetical protein n=1 Tax=Streptomyces sp. NPDC102395 TaxID=3366168 RepID=UPI003803E8B8